jgi:5-methylcytosine-specific restriction enzyme A
MGRGVLRNVIQKIAVEYPNVIGEPFARHPLADFIRRDAVEELHPVISAQGRRFRCKGSAGNGNFAAVPWIAVFDEIVTSSAITGYYVVYLFSTNGTVHLSLNQGTTAVRQEFGRQAPMVLADRASLMRARLPEFTSLLPVSKIDLHVPARLPRDYEFGHAIGCTYQIDALPGDNELSADLSNCLSAYATLTFRGGLEPSLEPTLGLDLDRAGGVNLVEMRRYRLHRTIERNYRLAEAAKAILGSQCRVCGFSFEAVYGELGAGFIEAHHLRPISTLEENVAIPIDPGADFAVLCSNCHRMIHRLGAPSDLNGLRALLAHN